MLLCDKTQNAILIKVSNFTVEVYVKHRTAIMPSTKVGFISNVQFHGYSPRMLNGPVSFLHCSFLLIFAMKK